MVVSHYGPSSQALVLAPIPSFSNWSLKNMKLGVFILGDQLQVSNPVIRSVMILMVHHFADNKVSTKVLFHSQSMLQYITAEISMWVIRRVYFYISTRSMSSSSFPIWMCISHIVIATFLKVTSITMSTNEHYWLMLLVIPTTYFDATTTCTIRQESSNGGQGL